MSVRGSTKKIRKRPIERFSDETVPTFAELLEFLKDYKGLIYVELKCKKDEIATARRSRLQNNQTNRICFRRLF